MSLPTTNFDPGFHITRASHVVLTVRDLAASRRFYKEVIGLILTAEDDSTLYFRGVEEACHHSLVLRKAADVSCLRIGLRVFSDRDLEKLKTFFETQGCPAAWVDVPHQGRTLHATDPAGTPLEFCATMPVMPRMITKFTRHAGGSALRLDHYQILTPEVRKACEFYMAAGFRLSEYVAPSGTFDLRGVFLQRKGNPHDIVFFNGAGGAPPAARLRCRGRARFRGSRRARSGAAWAGACDVRLYARPRRPSRRAVQHPLSDHGYRERAGRLGPFGPQYRAPLGLAGAAGLV